jgi:serine/threonine protein kinase
MKLEAGIMAQFTHENVIGLIGVVTAGDPFLCVMEYCEKGSLQSHLKAHGSTMLLGEKMDISLGIARGLAYLHSLNFVHRDVAARNVLLSAITQAKIADFGLTREADEERAYYRSKGTGALPVRWTGASDLFLCVVCS